MMKMPLDYPKLKLYVAHILFYKANEGCSLAKWGSKREKKRERERSKNTHKGLAQWRGYGNTNHNTPNKPREQPTLIRAAG